MKNYTMSINKIEKWMEKYEKNANGKNKTSGAYFKLMKEKIVEAKKSKITHVGLITEGDLDNSDDGSGDSGGGGGNSCNGNSGGV